MKEFKQKYNDDFYTGSIIRILEVLGDGDGARPSRPTRSRSPRRWKG